LVIFTVLLVPSLAMAGYHSFGPADAVAKSDNTIEVPLQITNQDGLAAIDIPLHFSDGVTLTGVSFEGTRVEYFDLQAVLIDNEANTVVIGLLPQMSATAKPDLEAGTGTIANLQFTIDDPSVSDVTIEAVEMVEPDHELLFVYRADNDQGMETIAPEFEPVTVALSPQAGEQPGHFELGQSYPNPFNPTTTIPFSMEQEGDYSMTFYNVTGQVVDTRSGHGTAGQNSVVWDGARYSSGVYFYRLEADGKTATKKMVLLK
jgi:hypothetical protein